MYTHSPYLSPSLSLAPSPSLCLCPSRDLSRVSPSDGDWYDGGDCCGHDDLYPDHGNATLICEEETAT